MKIFIDSQFVANVKVSSKLIHLLKVVRKHPTYYYFSVKPVKMYSSPMFHCCVIFRQTFHI